MEIHRGCAAPLAHRAAAVGTWGRAIVAMLHRVRRPTVVAILLLLLTPVDAQSAGELERLREKTSEMIVAVNRCQAATHADGRAPELDQAYARFRYLLTPEKNAELDRLLGTAQDEVARARYRRLAGILQLHGAVARVASLYDASLRDLRSQTVMAEDTQLRLLDLDRRLMLQPDRDQRLAWWMATGPLCQRMAVYRRGMLGVLDQYCRELGYAGYYDLLQIVEGWDPEQLRAVAERVLDDTEAPFLARLETLSQAELGLEVRRVRTYDAEFLFSFPTLSASIGERDWLDLTGRALAAAGMDLRQQNRLTLRVGEKRDRAPQAAAWPLAAGEAVVSMVPTGGLSDLPDLLEAVGEGQFYVHMPGDLPFEDAFVGTNILPATVGALCAMIAEEPVWVAEAIGPEMAEEVAAAMKLRRLYLARRAAGECLFELELRQAERAGNQGGDQVRNADRCKEITERALAWPRIVARDHESCLLACDGYRSGGRLLGFVLAAQIRDALAVRWGPDWYAHQALGALVETAARHGYAVPLEEFLAEWGVSGLDPGVMARQFAAG